VSEVTGLDEANVKASMLGEFELSMGVPLMGYNVITQMALLSEALNKMADLVISQMVPNVERMRHYAESSPSLITVLSPKIGYDKATEIGRQLAKGKSIRQALKELGYTDAQIDELLNLKELTKPGIHGK